MRKQLYLDIQTLLMAIEDSEGNQLFKHFDLWNQQVDFLEEETPFEFPAVFVEFMPNRWETKGRRQQQSDFTIRLHIVTRWFAQTAEYSPEQSDSLDYLDLTETVLAAMQNAEATQSNAFVRTGSTPNHNHRGILDSIEEYVTRVYSNAAVKNLVPVTPDLMVYKDNAPVSEEPES